MSHITAEDCATTTFAQETNEYSDCTFSTYIYNTTYKAIYRSSIVKWLKVETRGGKHKSSRVCDKWCNVICNDFLHNCLIKIIQPNTHICLHAV